MCVYICNIAGQNFSKIKFCSHMNIYDMASSLSSNSCNFSLPFCKFKEPKYPQVRSQSFSNDGTSANMVDANMKGLRERIAEVRMKERLENYCSSSRLHNGWNYQCYGYDESLKRHSMLCELFQIITSASAALAFVFLAGSLCLLLVSALLHKFTTN